MPQTQMRLIHRGSAEYPGKMQELSGMPETLYAIGSLPDPDTPSVAIVGARLCSSYGRETALMFGRALAEKGVQIISGMAAGIDGSAQEGALSGGGKSFAVLAGGADVCYPRAHTTLYNQLKKQGGVLSEQPPGTPPKPYYFPSRNRLISALSDIVLVVEARARSGSLITVDFALTQGKTVFAVPGRVGDPLSDGCNYLIAQGAGIAYSPDAILSELKLTHDTISFVKSRERAGRFRHAAILSVENSTTLTPEAKTVYRKLSFDTAFCPDAIAGKTDLPLPLVRAALSELMRENLITEPERDSYQRTRFLPDLNTLSAEGYRIPPLPN